VNGLIKIGFINVGHWSLMNDRVQYHLASHQTTKNVLYSFVSNGTIKYIGKTTVQLSRRMYGYQNPGPSQSTNIRVNDKIKTYLLSEQPVDIFILVDNGLLKYGNFKLNLAAALEDTLIYEFNPEWNYSGKHKLEEDKNSSAELIEVSNPMELQDKSLNSFDVAIGQAYYNQGFFNVKQRYSDQFSADKAIIEIKLGDNPNDIIQGYINRTANSNGTPRIMGGKILSEWIKKHLSKDENMKVDILSPVSIRLNK
jgi:hypothetical protein